MTHIYSYFILSCTYIIFYFIYFCVIFIAFKCIILVRISYCIFFLFSLVYLGCVCMSRFWCIRNEIVLFSANLTFPRQQFFKATHKLGKIFLFYGTQTLKLCIFIVFVFLQKLCFENKFKNNTFLGKQTYRKMYAILYKRMLRFVFQHNPCSILTCKPRFYSIPHFRNNLVIETWDYNLR